jgi:hypothetical protein
MVASPPTIPADRPDLTPPRTLARGRHFHRRHLGPTLLTGRKPTHASRARTPLLAAQRARRVPLPGRRASPAVARRQDHAQPQPR